MIERNNHRYAIVCDGEGCGAVIKQFPYGARVNFKRYAPGEVKPPDLCRDCQKELKEKERNGQNPLTEREFLMSHAIHLGGGRYEIPSISFVEATKMTKRRLPEETVPPD